MKKWLALNKLLKQLAYHAPITYAKCWRMPLGALPSALAKALLKAQLEHCAKHKQHIRGLEDLVAQMRELQGMSDSLNQELNQRLQEALASSDRLTLMLPSPASNGRRPRWRIW